MFVTYENSCVFYEMAQVSSEKRKYYVLTKKKGLGGSTTSDAASGHRRQRQGDCNRGGFGKVKSLSQISGDISFRLF